MAVRSGKRSGSAWADVPKAGWGTGGHRDITTVYVYDAMGELAAEYESVKVYNQAGTPSPGTNPLSGVTNPCGALTCYVSADQLGSTRMVTDSTGAVKRRYDYLPFGEELGIGTGGRTAGMGYQSSGDGFSPKFTGQVRDWESHLDYFNARYYSPEQGRFVSPDPENAGANPAAPQTWNGYSYAGNNPVNVVDPSGLGFFDGLLDFLFGIGWDGGFGGLGGITNIPGLAGVNDRPWNEQVPIGGSSGGLGGGLNTGDVFGSGNTGPFVFSVLQAAGSREDVTQYDRALQYLARDPGLKLIIEQLRKSSKVYQIRFTDRLAGSFDARSNEIVWNPLGSSLITGGCASPVFILGHELAHAAGWDSSWLGLSYAFRTMVGDPAYKNREERRVITGPEAAAARTLGEPTRNNHQTTWTMAPNSTARICDGVR